MLLLPLFENVLEKLLGFSIFAVNSNLKMLFASFQVSRACRVDRQSSKQQVVEEGHFKSYLCSHGKHDYNSFDKMLHGIIIYDKSICVLKGAKGSATFVHKDIEGLYESKLYRIQKYSTQRFISPIKQINPLHQNWKL